MPFSPARQLFAKNALLADGWSKNVLLQWDEQGVICAIKSDLLSQNPVPAVEILVPGMANLHCHAFQRAMAGLAETRGHDRDSFWSWRKWMYSFAQILRPEEVEAIAAMAYMEMLQSGFTAVGEFHYLHHQADGRAYDNPAEMSDRVIAAADHAGISQTLLPVFYAHSDFDGKDPVPQQARFVHNLDSFCELTSTLRKRYPKRTHGFAAHSLRAVTPEQLGSLLNLHKSGPVHVHVAEQTAEVDACKEHLGARPVQFLLDTYPVDQRWCLVHATHVNENEVALLANSGAVAGLCPITEANLGDGLFSAGEYHKAGGVFGIGSDSCVRIDLAEELRLFEYGQRLKTRRRTILAKPGKSVGAALYVASALGGAQALGQQSGAIQAGNPASFVSLDFAHPAMAGRQGNAWLDSWLFAANTCPVQHVWQAGKQQVVSGLHVNNATITNAYTRTLIRLMRRIGD